MKIAILDGCQYELVHYKGTGTRQSCKLSLEHHGHFQATIDELKIFSKIDLSIL